MIESPVAIEPDHSPRGLIPFEIGVALRGTSAGRLTETFNEESARVVCLFSSFASAAVRVPRGRRE